MLNLIRCGEKEQKIEKEVVPDMIGIILEDRSYVRLDPVLSSTVVAYTKLGEKVGILDRSKEKTWIGNTDDYWYKIKISGGFVGWTYGSNLKIFTDADSDDINDFLKEFWRAERKKLLGKLTGRWWSVDKYDNFTNQCVELHNNGRYKAYCTGCTPVEGEYEINYRSYKITFSKGTSFGDSLNYIMRGDAYILKKSGQDQLKFRRIKRKFDETDAKSGSDENGAKQNPHK